MPDRGWSGRLRAALETIRDAALPAACVTCGRTGAPICDACLDEIPPVASPRCPWCGAPLPASTSPHHFSRCTACRSSPGIPRARTAGTFDGTLRDAIHAFKYRDRPDAAPALAALLEAPAREVLGGATPLVVPVPLHATRADERGFDQAALLARHLGRRQGWNVVPALRRTTETHSQVGLGRAARRANVSNAFTPVRRLDGATVLLIDDVMTTGATLTDAARACRVAGAATVLAACLARDLIGGPR